MWLLQIRIKTKIFEKKPKNGGIPAVEKKAIVKILVSVKL